jgi:hypothetical protein
MRFAPAARTVDAEAARRPPRGQEDGVNEASVVTEFRWIEAGGGLAVLRLHGLFGASDHWERLVEAVSPRCRAMALSLPIFETPYHDGSAPTGLHRPAPRTFVLARGGPGSGLVLSKTGPLSSLSTRGRSTLRPTP